MGEIMNQIWPYLLTAMVTAVGTYIGAIHKLRIKVAVLEFTPSKKSIFKNATTKQSCGCIFLFYKKIMFGLFFALKP